MDSRQDRQRALGTYRGPAIDLVIPLLFGTAMLLMGLVGRERDWWAISVGILLFAIALAPETIVRRSGILLLYRCRRIAWTDIAAIQEVDVPRSRECLRVRRHDDRIYILRGVPADRLPGLIHLARQASSQTDQHP